MDLDNILIPLYEAEVKKLRTILKRRRFEFAERAHAHFTAKKGRLHVTVYENGPKALVQGKRRGSLRGMCWSGWCWVGSLGALLRGAARGLLPPSLSFARPGGRKGGDEA